MSVSASTPHPESDQIDRLLSPSDVAALLGVCRRTVNRMVAGQFAGRPPLRPIIHATSVVRFRRSDLEAWLNAGIVPAKRGRGRPRKYDPATGK